MAAGPLEIVYEDNHLLAVVKPAGLATMGLAADRTTLLTLAREYVKQRYGKPGKVYLGVISRLDVPVTGIVLFARTSKAARRLTEQFRTRAVEKTYWALVEGKLREAAGECVGWVVHDDRHRRVHRAAEGQPGAKEARLWYRRLREWEDRSLVEIGLETGRKHQIRLQLAGLGHPILGDRKYGSRRSFPGGIALHARCLVVAHPVRDENLVLEAPVPRTWHAFGVTQ